MRVVTPASAMRAMSKIINKLELVARLVPVEPAHIEINNTITNACEMVIIRPPKK